MAVAVLLTASCAKEDISSSIAGGEANVTFTVDLPELGTRAYADGTNATLLRYFVFDASNGAELEALRGTATTSTGKFTFTLPLLKGMEYNIALWADKNIGTEDAPQGYYQFDGRDVTVSYFNANDNDRDAFYHYEPNFDPTDPRTTSFQLYRPFAQLNAAVVDSDIVAVGKNEVELTTSTVNVTTYTKFNLATGDVVESSKTVVTFDEADMPYEAGETLKDGYKYLSMNYLLVPKAGMVSNVTFTFNNSKDINFGTSYDNVPLKQNYRTNILGALLTKPTEFNVEIEADFNQPDEFASRFDPATRTITIGSAEELLGLTALSRDWVAKFSNGLGTTYPDFATINGGKGVDYYYKGDWTIKLDTDINLEVVTLDAPIYVADWKLFDGQGHTIKNVKVVTANNNAGLFVGGNCGFKNIVLDNVNVTGSLIGGSNAAILAANCNSPEGATGITIKNSSVWGGKYTGGVVGYGYTHTTGCTLENCVIKGGYKLGGVIGYICTSSGPKAVDNNTLINCTVAGTDGQYADGKSEYIMGRVVGNFNSDGSCIGNKVSNMTTVATANIGKIESGKNVTVEDNKVTPHFDPASRTLTIGSASELLGLTELNNSWVAKFSNGLGTEWPNYAVQNGGKGTDYYYKWDWTIKLDTDIDLEGVTLNAPINITGFGTFDGQNHTIKNVYIVTNLDTENKAALFASNKYGAIKNVILDNIHVKGSLVGNSTAAILASDCNSNVDAVTIKNSSVWGGKYTGAVVGYGYTNITNCILENCVVKGGYKLGGVIGYISASDGNASVDNNTLNGCTVEGTDGDYAAGKSEYIAGKVVGNFNANGTCLNNTVTNMTTTIATENIGKIEGSYTVQQ